MDGSLEYVGDDGGAVFRLRLPRGGISTVMSNGTLLKAHRS
jgi:hypothetical protein